MTTDPPPATLAVGLVQMTSGDDPTANLEMASRLVREAAASGARLIATPEVTNCVSLSRARQEAVLAREEDDPTLAGLRALARDLGITLLVGSLALRTEERRFANRSFLVGPDGGILARYDKIHMFDVALGSGESDRERDGYRPGTRAVLAEAEGVPLGMTICYDLRFPGLFRHLAQAGARILAVPSAFTRPTGEAHWRTLLRARAIETGAFVVAPAQTGTHPTSEGRARQTWGHSLIVDPWGKVLVEMDEAPGVAVATLDLGAVEAARGRVGSLRHEPPWTPADA